MLCSLQSARTVLRAIAQARKLSRAPASSRTLFLCAACAQRLRSAKAPTCTVRWHLDQLAVQHNYMQGRQSCRQLCSLIDTTAPEIAHKQDSTWKATFPAVPAAAVDEFSDALLCYGATAVRRATAFFRTVNLTNQVFAPDVSACGICKLLMAGLL